MLKRSCLFRSTGRCVVALAVFSARPEGDHWVVTHAMERGAPAAGAAAAADSASRNRWLRARRQPRWPASRRRTAGHERTVPLVALVCAAVLACHAPVLTVGFVDDFTSICGNPDYDEVVTVNYACGYGSRVLPLSLEYGSGGDVCPDQFQGAPPAKERCVNVTSESVTTACVGQQLCTVSLPSWIRCNDSLWKVNYVRRSYMCSAGESWHDACSHPTPAFHTGVRLFVYFGFSSPRSCVCNVSLLSPADSAAMEVLREPDASLARLTASQTTTIPPSAYGAEARDDVNAAADIATTTESISYSTGEIHIDKCVAVTSSSTLPTETSRQAVISYSGDASCRSKYTLVYSIRAGATGSFAQWAVECKVGEDDGSKTSSQAISSANSMNDSSTSRRPNASSSSEATVVSSTPASQSSTVALAAGLTGGLVGAAIAGTVLATAVMRLRREKLPRRSAGSDVRRPTSSRKASRQQSTMVISESDYNSRDHDGGADHYYELPSTYASNGGVPATPARPPIPTPSQDYANGYIEALRDGGGGGSTGERPTPPPAAAAAPNGVVSGSLSANAPNNTAEPSQEVAGDATERYETPMAFGGSLPNAFYYESLKHEPSTQL